MGGMLVRQEPTSAATVRHRIADDLGLEGVPPDSIDEVTLVASELVGNAVRHAGSPDHAELDVSWDLHDDHVLVAVCDGSTTAPAARVVAATEPSGRGLTIVAALADEWGVDPIPHGKRVWASVPVLH